MPDIFIQPTLEDIFSFGYNKNLYLSNPITGLQSNDIFYNATSDSINPALLASGDLFAIQGNDLLLYDNSSSAIISTSNTGSAASILFPRKDDATQRFIVQKRVNPSNDDDNILEMFYDKAANNSRYNYIFLGQSGTQTYATCHTDVFGIMANKLWGVAHSNHYGGYSWSVSSSDYTGTGAGSFWGNGTANNTRSRILFYDSGTTLVFSSSPNFTLGEEITGGTSGAIGYIGTKTDVNHYTAVNLTKEFTDGETITGSISGFNGTLVSHVSAQFNASTGAGGGLTVLGHHFIKSGSLNIALQLWLDAYNIWLSEDMLPYTDNTYTLGDSTHTFKEVWVMNSPTSDSQVANKGYVDSTIGNVITFPAGQNLSVREAVYLSTGSGAGSVYINTGVPDTYSDIYGSNWGAQTFLTPSQGGATQTTVPYVIGITSIELYLARVNNPSGNITLAIYATDANYKPTGSALTSFSELASTITGGGAFGYYEFPISFTMLSNTIYAMVFNCINGDATNRVQLGKHSVNVYAEYPFLVANKVCQNYSTDSGATWTQTTTADYHIAITGINSTSYLYKTSALFNDERSSNWIGLMSATTNANSFGNIKISGLVSGFTGLTPFSKYYLSNTPGAISSTAGTYSTIIGKAITSTFLLLIPTT